MKKTLVYRISIILVISLLLSMMLTGCGGSDQKEVVEEGNEAKETVSSDEEKIFVYPVPLDVPDLLPISGDDTRYMVVMPLYDKLFTVTKDEILYRLAEDCDVSEDNLKYTLKLRKDAKWHDGEPITSDDFLFTIDVMKEMNSITLTKVDNETVDIKKIDEHTVEIVLPNVSSPYFTNLGRCCLIPAHVFNNDPTKVEGSEESMLGIGSGPFKLGEWNKGESLVYVKNEDYYRGEPNFDKLVMKIIPEESAKEVALQNGEISFMRITTTAQYDKYANDNNYEIFSIPEGRVNYLQTNPVSEKINSKEAREAIFYALNLDEIMETVYGSEKMAEAATSVFAPQNLYFNDSMENYKQDLEKAKKLAKETGLEGQTLKYIYNNQREGMADVALVVQQQLKQIGIDVQVEGLDSPTYFGIFFKSFYGEGDKSWDLGTNGWDQLNADPGTQLPYYTNENGDKPDTTDMSPKSEKLILDAKRASNLEERERLYKEAQESIKEDFAFYPISCPNYVMVAQKGYKGLDEVPIVHVFDDYLTLYKEDK